MPMSLHAPLSRQLRRAQRICEVSAHSGIPVDELADGALPRRAVLAGGAASGLLAATRARAGSPRVVVVGAGLAGLTAAWLLWKRHGIAAAVYEWDTHVGGRVETLRGFFADGIVAEQHGEFISSEHQRMRALAARFGLPLERVSAHLGDAPGTGWFGGTRFSQAAFVKLWRDYAWELFRDAIRAAPSATWQHASPAARAWDRLSVPEWLERHMPGGLDNPVSAACLADVTSEYGGPPEEQSALNLIYTLGYDASAKGGLQSRAFPVLAGTDEAFHVRGGNDQFPFAMAAELPAGAIRFQHRLVAVSETAGRGYVCTFDGPGGTVEAAADHVVLAIPPTTLRDVALHNIPLLPVQRRAIAGATLGNNAKIQIQVAGRPWLADGYSGDLLTDQPIGGGWDAGSYQPGGHGPNAGGLYICYLGGRSGRDLAKRYGLTFGVDEMAAPAAMVRDALAQLEPAFPGVTAAWQAGPRRAWVNDGNIDPHLRGAYSYFQIGQYTSFNGAQSLPAGGVHFAGEHTSEQFQGFMEGAVQSGERAVKEITGT